MFANMPKPKHSPWGYIQDATQIAPGIWSVSTSGHGGFMISDERLAAMPEMLRDVAHVCGSPKSFEEDCEWSLVVLAFPDEFKGAEVVQARQSAGRWYPAVLAAFDISQGRT